MNIIQMSAPKSGSYWLYKILTGILKRKGLANRSFIRQQPVYSQASGLSLSFEGQADVDMLDIEVDGCFYRISSICREPVREMERYLQTPGIVWTHSSICRKSFEILPMFDKRICIIRDPRDRALSSAMFAFTPYMKTYYPTTYGSPEEYLSFEYERLIDQWIWYAGNFLLYKDQLDIHVVFYERFLSEFNIALKALLTYLDIDLSESEQTQVASAVSWETMKRKNPDHLQRGQFGKWIRQLTQSQMELAVEKAGGLLHMLNYPLEADQNALPSAPQEIPRRKIKKLLSQVEWDTLFTSRSSR